MIYDLQKIRENVKKIILNYTSCRFNGLPAAFRTAACIPTFLFLRLISKWHTNSTKLKLSNLYAYDSASVVY